MNGLRELLGEAAERARVYDVVARAERKGRRRRRVGIAVTVAAVTAAVLSTGTLVNAMVGRPRTIAPVNPTGASPSVDAQPSLPAPTSCVGQRLPIPDGYPRKAVVTGGDPTGRFLVGSAYTRPGQPDVLVWDNGTVTAVASPVADLNLYDINSAGDAVGFGYASLDTRAAFAYHRGELVRLTGGDAQAVAINASGAIVGSLFTSDAAHRPVALPVLWPSPSAPPTALALPAGATSGAAIGIDDDGTILGVVSPSAGPLTATLWRPDLSRVEVTFPNPDGAVSQRMTLSGFRGGWTSVELWDGVTVLDWYMWNVRTGQARRVQVYGDVVNARGWIAGATIDQQPAIGSDYGILPLPRLDGVAYDGDVTTTVRSLSDDGRTVGGYLVRSTASFGDDDNVPVVWHCR